MNKTLKRNLLLIAVCLCALPVAAKLSSNPYKFLGNITTRGAVEAGGGVPKYYTLWNQITCENESKWSSVEGTRGNFNWVEQTMLSTMPSSIISPTSSTLSYGVLSILVGWRTCLPKTALQL